MALVTSEHMWSTMIAARQLSATYYTISTCLTDILHRYFEISSSQTNDLSSSLFNHLYQTLFSSVSTNLIDQSKLLAEYSNLLQNILKQNSLHTNIIQNVRRLFRSDLCLKQLFTTELNEHCQCQECDCTISNSVNDVIHDVGEIRSTLLTESSQISCVCFRCADQNQIKILTFKQFSPCLALTVNRLNINATDQLINPQGVIYDLTYIIQFDSTSRSIINVYLRQDTEFIKVDGTDISSRISTINNQGKFLTLWLSRSSSPIINQSSELTTISHNDTFLSPPQSASSSSQLIQNSTTTTATINDTSIPYQSASTITFDDISIPTNDNDIDDSFWNTFTEQSINPSSPIINENLTTTTNNDDVNDLYLTLLHSKNKNSSTITSRTEHDRTVNTLASDILWPIIVNQTKRRSEKKLSSSSSTTTTVQSISSNSSNTSSTIRKNRLYKQLPSTVKSRRTHPYTTA